MIDDIKWEYLMKDWDASFGPSYTPMEMLDEGIFEGIYTHAIEGIPAKYKSHKNVIGDKGPDVEINKFKVKSRQSLKEWQKKKWTTKLSPLGWWEWYIKYFEGRRDEKEDKLQISRWNSYVARHQGQIKANCKLGDLNCRPKQRQGLLQWGWDSTTAYTDDQVAENAKRLSRLSGNSKLATESFSSLSPDLIRLGVSAGELLHNEIKKNKGKREKTKTPSGMKFTPTLNPAAYLPFVSVKEEKGYVTVSGFSMKKFAGSVTSLLGTARFKNMFHSTNARGFVIESFFVIEILKVTDLLLSGKSRTNGKILKSIRDGLLKNTWVAKTNAAEAKDFKYDNLKRLNINLLPKQRQFLEEYAELVPRLGLKGWLLAAAPGTGKALRNGTKVKLLDGWCSIEDLEIGDIVVGDDGLPTKVTGVYPQGKVDLYEITFYDGRKAIACGEHLWRINDGRLGKKPHDERWCVTNTKDIYEYFKTNSRFRCYIPLTKPVQMSEKRLSINPYLIGCLLGDGSFCNKAVLFYKVDPDIVDKISTLIDDNLSLKPIFNKGKLNGYRISRDDTSTPHNVLFNKLKSLGLTGMNSKEKFIPGLYLEGSVEQRWELIRGLMDTDGTVDKKTATISYSTSSILLAEGFVKLVRSLGAIAKISSRVPTYTHNGERRTGSLNYNITVRHREPYKFFSLPRKKELTRKSQYSENLKLSIVDIKPIGVDEATCISVDNESKLFLIDDYIVTHNTITGYAWHMVQDFDVLIVIAPNNTIEDVWEKTFYRFFNKIPKYWLSRPNFKIKGDEEFIITHYEHLEKTISELHKFKGKRIGLWVDESHNFNELTSNRTNHLIDMAKEYVDEAVLASGTPLKALGKELVPLFRITDELFTPSVEEKFIRTFGSTKGAVLELLNYRMDRVSFKVHKSEVVNNVVTEVSHGIKIPNGDKYTLSNVAGEIRAYVNERLSHYTAIKEEIIEGYFDYINKYKSLETDMTGFDEYIRTARKLHTSFNQYTDGDLIKLCSRYERDKILPLLEPTERKSFKQIAARYKYPLLVVRGEALGRILTRRRIECMVDMVPYADLEVMVDRAKKKTVIFTNYVEIVNAIADHLKTMGHKPIIVHGETTDQLTNNLKRFLEDPTANPIVTTYKSLSTGTPLISASTIVLYDSPFRNYIIEQTISRADRLDQDSDIEVVRPYLDTGDQDNLSTRSIELAALSKEMVDAILKLDKVDTRLLSVESYSGQRLLSREYYSSGDLVVEKVKCDKELYYVDIYPNPPSKLTLNPTYPQGSKFAKDNHLPDHWVYDAAVERVELHSSIIGALRAKYSEWKELIEKHGTDGLQFNIYKCTNSDKVEWLNPTSLINYRYDYDAHFTDAWWGFGSVDLELLQADGRVTAGKNGRRTPKGSYWFHCDDSTPFALIQVYGDEHVIEHSPIDLEVIGNLYSEEVEVTGATKSGRALSTESYHELEKDKGSPHSVVYRRNDTELYHISFQPLGKLLKPRLPAGSELMDSESTHWSKEPDIPRICFSETIEGCVRAIYPNISKLAEEYDELEFYLYKVPANSSGLWVPPWALCEDGMVWDATLTKEWWSLSDVKIRESGKVSFKFNTDGKWLSFTTPTGKKVEHSPMEIEITQVGGGYGR